MKILLPSRLGTGVLTFIGPVVNWTGARGVGRRRPPRSLRAQRFAVPSRTAWKTKYLPSGVHLPQHSLGVLFQPGSKARRLPPSAETCHRERLLVLGSLRVKRKIDPSGDQRISLGVPAVNKSWRGLLPSLFARSISFPLQ